MGTTFFTCCDKKYEHFIPIFLHSILYHNIDVDVEIGVEDLNQDKNIVECINYIKSKYEQSRIELRKVSFKPITIRRKDYGLCPNVVRFIETPTIKNDFVYICDIDIITLQKNISQIHINDMDNTGLNYSNIVRPSENKENKRLTGLHFTRWDAYYPIPIFTDLTIRGYLGHDEIFLYQLVAKKNKILETHSFRPVHGIHMSLNRSDLSEWGIKKWKREWLVYRNSDEFLFLEKLFSTKITDNINKIDDYYNAVEKSFTEKYIQNSWKGSESKSGPGSSLKNNKTLIENLENFVIENSINTMIDCGCGDFNWMKSFNFNLIKSYLGVDIVKPLIEKNKVEYENKIIKFKHLNIIEDCLDEFDIILCKDVLFLLSYKDALAALENFKKSRSKYLISTTFYDYENKDISTGSWRPINLQTEPFLLGEPMLLWKNIENKTTGWISKSIGIWEIN